MADSGATVNVSSKRNFDGLKLNSRVTDMNVKCIFEFQAAIARCGKLRANLVSNRCASQETFYVEEGS